MWRVLRVVRRLVLSIVVVLAMLFASALLLPKTVLQNLIEKDVARVFKGHGTVNGEVKIVFTPWPTIIMDNIFLPIDDDEFIRFTNCSYKFNPLILAGISNFSELEIGVVEANLMTDRHRIDRGELLNFVSLFDELHISSGIITFVDVDGSKLYLDNTALNLHKSGIISKSYNIAARYSINNRVHEYQASFADSIIKSGAGHVKMNSKLLGFELDLDGDIANVHDFPAFDGDLRIAIDKGALMDRSNMTISYLALSAMDAAFEGKIKIDSNKLSAPELKLVSQLANDGMLSLSYLFQDSENLQVNLAISKIDLNAHKLHEQVNPLLILENYIKTFEYTMPKFLDGTVTIGIEEIDVNQSKIEKLDFGAQISDGKAMLKKFSAVIDETGSFSVEGTLSSNNVRPKFEGKIVAMIPKLEDLLGLSNAVGQLALQTDVVFIPRVLRLDKLKAVVGDAMLKGNVFFRDAAKHSIDINLNLVSSAINADALGITPAFDKIISTLYTYDFDKSGQSFGDLLVDVTNDKEVNFDVSAELTAEKFIFRGMEFAGFHSNFSVNDEIYNISDFSAKSDRLDFAVSAMVDLSQAIPEFNLDAKFNKADVEVLQFMLPKIADLAKQQRLVVDKLHSEGKISSAILADPANLSDLNFFSMQNFNGDIKLWFDSLNLYNMPLSNLKVDVGLSAGTLLLNDVSAQLLGGDGKLNGSAFIADKIPNFKLSATINNFDPKQLLWYQFSYSPIGGYMSLSSSIQAMGYDTKDLMNSMVINTQMIGKQIQINNYNFVGVAKLVDSDAPFQTRLDNLDKTLNSEFTVFDNLTGAIDYGAGVWNISNVTFSNNRLTGGYSGSYVPSTNAIVGAGVISFIPAGSQAPLNINFSATGALNSQDVKIDTSSLAHFMQSQVSKQQAAQVADNPTSLGGAGASGVQNSINLRR